MAAIGLSSHTGHRRLHVAEKANKESNAGKGPPGHHPKGFHTRLNPIPSKSLSLTVATSVTPWATSDIPSGNVVQAFERHANTTASDLRQLPTVWRHSRRSDSREKQLQPAPGHFGQGNLTLLSDLFRPTIELVRQLYLGADHDIRTTSRKE